MKTVARGAPAPVLLHQMRYRMDRAWPLVQVLLGPLDVGNCSRYDLGLSRTSHMKAI